MHNNRNLVCITTETNKKSYLHLHCFCCCLIQSVAVHYLIHRFLIINDFTYWRRFLSETEHYTLWLDYSQTINFTEKRQVQSAHFSGRQHTLHDTVLQAPKNGKHIYHLSDDTNHDSVMTFSIIKDIIHCHPEVI